MGAIYSAAAGLKGQQTRLDTIAANIANTNTVGYKSVRADFKDALYMAMDNPVGNSEAANLLAGNGVLLDATTTDFKNGSLKETGEFLDFALRGNGYFTVENSVGEVLYTRNGNFNVSVEGGDSFLVTSQGYYVLDNMGNRIRLPKETKGISVTESGELINKDGRIAALGIANFTNPDGLDAAGDTFYRVTPASGAAAPPAEKYVVIQGSLEQSNVELAQELTLMIRAQRAYSLASKALQTADDMKGLSNNIR